MTKMIHRFLALLCFIALSLAVHAQEKKTVTGVVRDNSGNGLAGATISEKGTRNNVVSSDNGAFTIKVAPNATLVISYVGFATREVAADASDAMNIVLEGGNDALTGVVVTSLGITRRQKAVGYATSTIKAEDITVAGSPNFATALYGKAPGVRIAATPGGSTSAVNITIRGINSITGRSQPLIVLDGIPIRDGEVRNNDYWSDQRLRGNGLLDINPEDIDNISILKGASAAALYGSEAVNGVILITTKSGKGRKGINVDLNANYSFDKIAYLPRYQHVRGAGISNSIVNGGQDDKGFIYYTVNGQQIRSLPGFSINFGAPFDGQPILSWDGQIRPYTDQGDNYAGLFQTGQTSNVNVAVSKATENSNMRLSLTRQDNKGLSLGAENSKNIANLNSSFHVTKSFTTDVMINYINQHVHNRPYSIDRLINNFTGMMGRFDNADWYLSKYKTSRGYRYVTGTNQSLTPNENIIYPGFKNDIADYVWRLKEYNYDEYNNRVIASMTNTWQILKDLKIRGRIATDFTSGRIEDKRSTEVPLAFGNSGFFGLTTNQYTILYGDVLLTYNKKITPDIELNVMGGYTANKEKAVSTERETRDGLSVENWFDLKSSVNAIGGDDAFNYRRNLVKDAFLGTINGSYKNYFFLEGTIRRDRTSTMNPNNNSFVYPSVNSSFVFSDAFNLPSFFSFGKVRASWGIVGNYPDIYSANIAYNQNTLGVQASGGKPVLYTTISSDFGNDKIRPEEKHEIELGLETRFLHNRIGLDVSYYNGQIRDQILPITIPASAGGRTVLTNIGTLRNKGVEVAITATPVSSRDFKWDAGINFSLNKNVVEKLADGSTELLHQDFDGNAAQLKSVVGQPMGDFYVHPVAKNNKGEMIVGDDGLYQLDADNMIKIGNAMPKAIGGMFNTFSYKGFTLDALVDFRLGGYVMPTGINWMISRGLLEESLKYMDAAHGGLSYYLDANGKGVQTTAAQGPNGEKVYHDGMLLQGATVNGDKNTNVVSQAYYYWNVYNWGGPQYSEARYELYVQKNTYVKMRELSLAYTLPSKVASRLKAQKLQLSVFGRNLFYLYRTLKDLDAEQTVAGSRWWQTLTNAGTNPSSRSFGVMLRANF